MKKKVIEKFGKDLLRDPLLNKGTAFTKEERKNLHIEGLLPCEISSMREQLDRRLKNFMQKRTRMEKYQFLTDLQNRNETLFYRFLLENVEQLLPFVYTPAVGDASLNFSVNYHSSRGVYVPYHLEDEIESILRNCGHEDVDVIVASDGGRILGLGDVGIGGMVIPIGKCSLYTLFGSIDPAKTLPIFLDVGTDNKELLQDPLYIGVREKRLSKEKHFKFMDRFVEAVRKVFPKAMLQWEDLNGEFTFETLSRYQSYVCSFNDDIQGTAGVVLAGILSALKKKKTKLEDEKIAIFGAGTAGLGVANILIDYLIHKGLTKEKAYENIYLIDRYGLIVDGTKDVGEFQAPFARSKDEMEEWGCEEEEISLITTVEKAKITVLFGTSAQKGAFTEEIIKAVHENSSQPIIFPLSNPNEKAEATPQDILDFTDGKAIIATGSPYPDCTYKGKVVPIPQCNNVYIFPAIGLAATAFNFPSIPKELFILAGEMLSRSASKELFPKLGDLRDASLKVAIGIGEGAIEMKLIPSMSKTEMKKRLDDVAWFPEYSQYLTPPRG